MRTEVKEIYFLRKTNNIGYHLFMWNLKYDTTELYLRNRLTDTENRFVVAKGEKGRGRDVLGA